MSKYQMGPETLSVPMTLFKDNRTKLLMNLRNVNNILPSSVVFMKGGDDLSHYDTDVNYLFRQESFFFYLFGVTEPGCFGVIDIDTGHSILFVPHLSEDYSVWMGNLMTCNDFKLKYEVDHVYYVDEMEKIFSEKLPSVILTLSGKNSDSGLESQQAFFDGIDRYTVDPVILYPVISECRVIKSQAELDIIRYVCKVSSDAHKQVMKNIRPGHTEFQGESIFLHHSYFVGGCRHVSYTCICGSGTNSSILHYGHAGAPNDKIINNGDMCLFDMGANYSGYAADITCSFPVNGKFTDDQKFIYNSVLAARNAVISQAKPGVSWVDMHLLANRIMLEKLKEGNLLCGNVDDMITAGLNGIFQPHGLGHLVGLDVHDVGGYLENCPPRPTMPGVTNLRFARILKAGMYVTVEPGCYFIDSLINRALADPELNKFIVSETIERFRNFGGVRIEDDVVITENGCENYTFVPRTVEEIEEWMAN